jgi:predicted dehydrogenase
MKGKESEKMSRRKFISTGAAATAAFTIVPRHVLGGKGIVPPSDKLNIAAIGAGGKGHSDIKAASTENIVALCDVDDERAAKTYAEYPKAKTYKDFRVMLDKEKSIDAVTVSTPDHFHTVAAITALRMGKHVFVQKPLTHSVAEARLMREEARKYPKLATQMGNQGHAGEGGRLTCEWIWSGAIGDVREVHCWTNRPVWKTGMDRPTEIVSVPPTMDWNQWIGPAPWRPYNPAYAPWSWRAWVDFGTGALGDMGAHIFDHPYWALKLEYPETVQASSTKFNGDSWPVAEKITYTFPARGNMPPVKLIWYDGGLMPERPDFIEPGRKMGDGDGGVLYVGDKGALMHGCYGNSPRLLPETKMKGFKQPEKTIPRSPGIMQEWIQAIKEGKQSSTKWEYSSKLVETMMLGNVAVRVQDKNTVLEWDGEKGEITNLPEANEYLGRKYRKGWEL